MRPSDSERLDCDGYLIGSGYVVGSGYVIGSGYISTRKTIDHYCIVHNFYSYFV